jgi:hypothetical protein
MHVDCITGHSSSLVALNTQLGTDGRISSRGMSHNK